MTYWLRDDVLMDEYEFSLEPNFSPGPYTLYFGMFIGETRLKLTSGPGDAENRVNGGFASTDAFANNDATKRAVGPGTARSRPSAGLHAI